jgi:preprotein translocase subunit SecB
MADQDPVFQIQRVYLKEASLEQPNSPGILLEQEQPAVDIQPGIFEIRNLPQEQLGQIMGIACPQIVYPYLRGNVADLIQRGGFPPVHLSEINFQAMYEQQQAEAAGTPTGTLTQ